MPIHNPDHLYNLNYHFYITYQLDFNLKSQLFMIPIINLSLYYISSFNAMFYQFKIKMIKFIHDLIY